MESHLSEQTFLGRVTHLCRCPRAYLPMRYFDTLTLLAGKGVEGDRYADDAGYYSDRPEPGRQVTLFEIETLEALKRDYGIELAPHEHRRNITVRGVPLNHLVGRQFRVGPALLQGARLSTPCRHLEELTGKSVFNPLVHRAGLNCVILEGGVVELDAPVRIAHPLKTESQP